MPGYLLKIDEALWKVLEEIVLKAIKDCEDYDKLKRLMSIYNMMVDAAKYQIDM